MEYRTSSVGIGLVTPAYTDSTVIGYYFYFATEAAMERVDCTVVRCGAYPVCPNDAVPIIPPGQCCPVCPPGEYKPTVMCVECC